MRMRWSAKRWPNANAFCGHPANFRRKRKETRAALASVAEEAQRHLLSLPGIAQQEAQRIRQMVRNETEEMLDISARALSTIRARTACQDRQPKCRPKNRPKKSASAKACSGWRARSPDARSREAPRAGDDGKWEMSKLLAAVEGNENQCQRTSRPRPLRRWAHWKRRWLTWRSISAPLRATQRPSNEDWRPYLAGDRGVFARKLASAIDSNTVDRITELYREDTKFRDAADHYISEFETLLARAREGDGGGLLTPTILERRYRQDLSRGCLCAGRL